MLRETVIKTEGYASQQLPEVCRQMVQLARIQYTLTFVLGVIFLIFGIINGRKYYKLLKKEEKEDYRSRSSNEVLKAFLFLSSLISSVAGLILFIIGLTCGISPWFAPKVFLLERFIFLIKVI